jgi:hypothetical protein
MSEYDIQDSGGLAILEQACSATDRAEDAGSLSPSRDW